MIDFDVQVSGFLQISASIEELGPAMAQDMYGHSLFQMAKVIRQAARSRGFVYTDRTGRLRKSIRARRIAGTYFGRKYKRGRAQVHAGGAGARQAFLVHQGHSPPIVSQPYRYLVRAMDTTTARQMQVFRQAMLSRFPAAVNRAYKRGLRRGRSQGLSRSTIHTQTFGRTTARRGRRR